MIVSFDENVQERDCTALFELSGKFDICVTVIEVVQNNRLKNPNWREADQLAIYKHDRGVELGSTEKQLQLSNQSGT